MQTLAYRRHPVAQRTPSESFEAAHKGQKLVYTHVAVQRHVLRDVAHVLPRRQPCLDHVETGDARRSRRGMQIAGEEAQHRCLPGAIRPKQAHDLAGVDCERYIINRKPCAIALA